MNTGEQSKFAAFFSDHPRWETRDQRDDKIYTDALAEYNRLWPDPVASPGGRAPVVVFLGQPTSIENKTTGAADIFLPMYCRNSDEPVDIMLAFRKDGHPVKAADPQFADKEGNLAVHEKDDCLQKNETIPISLHLPSAAVSDRDRSITAAAFIASNGALIAETKAFGVHFPKLRK